MPQLVRLKRFQNQREVGYWVLREYPEYGPEGWRLTEQQPKGFSVWVGLGFTSAYDSFVAVLAAERRFMLAEIDKRIASWMQNMDDERKGLTATPHGFRSGFNRIQLKRLTAERTRCEHQWIRNWHGFDAILKAKGWPLTPLTNHSTVTTQPDAIPGVLYTPYAEEG